ncbi:hypothetical protein BN997_00296 [Oceanobacillus oncorhynchi]|uniref:Uncharacterized protein n=1 Tax=Oceanobacillus oncorhynchi TaxID=545501 RepID=A0A0A1MBQ2_9BACI|nr:hypothetical protein BN997_00296 [Oceanobacillus oncorhynchi]
MKENPIVPVTIPASSSSTPINPVAEVSCHSLQLTIFEGCQETLAVALIKEVCHHAG